jgi:hypothetical protein
MRRALRSPPHRRPPSTHVPVARHAPWHHAPDPPTFIAPLAPAARAQRSDSALIGSHARGRAEAWGQRDGTARCRARHSLEAQLLRAQPEPVPTPERALASAAASGRADGPPLASDPEGRPAQAYERPAAPCSAVLPPKLPKLSELCQADSRARSADRTAVEPSGAAAFPAPRLATCMRAELGEADPSRAHRRLVGEIHVGRGELPSY